MTDENFTTIVNLANSDENYTSVVKVGNPEDIGNAIVVADESSRPSLPADPTIFGRTYYATDENTYWTVNDAGTGWNEGHGGAGSGDMTAAVYDPTTVAGDAFDMDNMVEGTNLILTAAERTKLSNTYLSTGLTSGGSLSINGGDAATFDIASMEGVVVDNYTTPGTSDITYVSEIAKTAIVVSGLAGQDVTHVSVNSSGTVIQRATAPTPSQSRDEIYLGTLGHQGHTVVEFTFDIPRPIPDAQLASFDLMNSIGVINRSGNVISANGANLSIDRSAGEMFDVGVNYSIDKQTPNVRTSSTDTLLTFRYRYDNGVGFTEEANATVLSPALYNTGGGLSAVPGGSWTIVYAFAFPSGTVRLQYGQNLYNSLANAEAARQGEAFNTDPNLLATAVLRGWIIVRGGAGNLTLAADAKFIEADKFGGSAVGGTTSSTTDMQTAYDNSVTPEILTDATRLAVTVQRGSGADTDSIIEGKNGAGTCTSSVDGNGDIAANSFTPTTGLISNTKVWDIVAASKYTATPASTSTITMSDTSDFEIGSPLRYTDSGGPFYAVVTAIVTDTTITIAGAALDTGDDLTLLEVGPASQVIPVSLIVGGTYGDGVETDLLRDDALAPIRWKMGKAYCVAFEATHAVVDTGTEPKLNVLVNAAVVSTDDTNLGLQLGAANTWVKNSAVAINATNYDINYDEALELNCTAAGGTGDASDLTAQLTFILEK